ncbi:hypothetical protein A1F94_008814 [Pyrenophora tritici-repentis]|nr:hypothetical protein A1F99_106990 [Pyrenophora tritici-repentis]KAG9379919.1 hypothetical protein A1F94_008814 [Pyrenophora tritici-repentis]KAI1561581.1 hypothetical protein PtrEW13061_012192 [Pyrenophora tritici-repentis]KAI1562987.1 hypothetical protein PtrEW7m1_010746 [Pyrenophora tritici-repentis]
MFFRINKNRFRVPEQALTEVISLTKPGSLPRQLITNLTKSVLTYGSPEDDEFSRLTQPTQACSWIIAKLEPSFLEAS